MKLNLDYKKIWTEAITASLIIIISAIAIISFIVISDQSVDVYNPSAKVEASNGLDKIEEVIELLQTKYIDDLDYDKLTEGAIKGILAEIEDPYTRYLTAEEYKEETSDSPEEYTGIGIHMSWSTKEGILKIIGVMPNSPAKEAGLKSGDIVIKVDDKDITLDNIANAADFIRGEEGTEVVVTVMRGEEKLSFNIKRSHIVANSIETNIIDNIGYIRIMQFDVGIANQFKAAYTSLISENTLDGLIIDLRDNPGGLVSETLSIADILIGQGIILKVEYGDGTSRVYRATGDKCELPLVVLVNENSASASEILSGAIKDTDQGIVVGTTTFGKGIMQNIIGLEDGTGLSITVAEFYTASGNKIHGVGITPNIESKLPEGVSLSDVLGTDNDIQLKDAINVIKNNM